MLRKKLLDPGIGSRLYNRFPNGDGDFIRFATNDADAFKAIHNFCDFSLLSIDGRRLNSIQP